MMTKACRQLNLLTAFLLLCLMQGLHCGHVNAQAAITGRFENYFLAPSSYTPSSPLRLSYLAAQGRLSQATTVVVGALRPGNTTLLDENYVQTVTREGIFRAGRFRTAFGLSDWSDLYYYGLPNFPLIRSNAVPYDDASRLRLLRLDTGADFLATSHNLQYQISVVDMDSGTYQLAPRRWNTVVGREQTYFGSWIIGINALANCGSGLGQNAVTMYDLDWRWSAPSVQWRGEALASQTGGISIDGYYQDISYHSLWAPKSTFLLRTEELRSSGGLDQTSVLETIGIKQTIAPWLVAELSQAWGNHSPVIRPDRGTTLQLITFTDF